MREKIPLEKNIIYETIVTTYNKNGKPNASTMGITIDENNNIIIKPFLETDTSFNLFERMECVVNITLDPELFVLSTLFQNEFKKDQFIKNKYVNAPQLKKCEKNFIALKVVSSKKIAPYRAAFYCKIVHSEFDTDISKPYTRAFSSLIEILIHASRIIVFSKNPVKNYQVIKLLATQVKFHSNIIRRVSTEESIYQELLQKIERKLLSYTDTLKE